MPGGARSVDLGATRLSPVVVTENGWHPDPEGSQVYGVSGCSRVGRRLRRRRELAAADRPDLGHAVAVGPSSCEPVMPQDRDVGLTLTCRACPGAHDLSIWAPQGSHRSWSPRRLAPRSFPVNGEPGCTRVGRRLRRRRELAAADWPDLGHAVAVGPSSCGPVMPKGRGVGLTLTCRAWPGAHDAAIWAPQGSHRSWSPRRLAPRSRRIQCWGTDGRRCPIARRRDEKSMKLSPSLRTVETRYRVYRITG